MNSVAPLARCRGLTLRRGPRTLVRDLDLEVQAGERWAVVGPNGAGKTTLLHVLGGVLDADAGEVRLAGRDPMRAGAPELAAIRAIVSDRWTDPFSAPVIEVVVSARYRFGADEADVPGALACLRTFECAALADRDIRSLSRGERQRVALACALAQQTPLLLLDEPISHQDPRQQGEVLGALARLPAASVAALHDINAAVRYATHALLLSGQGEWRAGPADEVLQAGALERIFGTRFVEVPFEGRRWIAVDDRR